MTRKAAEGPYVQLMLPEPGRAARTTSAGTGIRAVDELVRSRRRTLAIVIEDDGRVIVRAPLRMARRDIDEFVRAREAWIRSRRDVALRRAGRFVPHRFVSGEQFPFLGELHPLQVVDRQRSPLAFDGGFRLARAAVPRAAALFERWYRKQARRVITERARMFAAAHGFKFKRIRIGSARKQWGSCTARGDLSFTWRLVMAPQPMIDYVVVHELVHLRHRNHSRRFWASVAAILPDHREREEWLEEHSASLRLI